MTTKKLGRPRHKKQIKKVKELRAKKLSYRQIAKLENKDLHSIFRWANYV